MLFSVPPLSTTKHMCTFWTNRATLLTAMLWNALKVTEAHTRWKEQSQRPGMHFQCRSGPLQILLLRAFFTSPLEGKQFLFLRVFAGLFHCIYQSFLLYILALSPSAL